MAAWHVVLTMGLLAQAGSAQAPTCRVARQPAECVSGREMEIAVGWDVGAATANLHCEMKNTSEVVLTYQVFEVSGQGERAFRFAAPDAAHEPQVKFAVWLGEDWRQPLAPIVHTELIRVLTVAEAERLEKMKGEAESQLRAAGWTRSEASNVGVVVPDEPSADRDLADKVVAGLGSRGMKVTRLGWMVACNPFAITPDRFDLLVLVSPVAFPAAAADAVVRYASAGGKLIVLGGPAFSELLWDIDGRWVGRDELRATLAKLPGRRVFLSFDDEDVAAWVHTSNAGEGSRISTEEAGEDGKGRCAHLAIRDLTGWDSFTRRLDASPFRQGEELTCFRARGDARTTEMSVEWQESDGSRWIAVVPLTPKWTDYALTPNDFHYWHDSSSKGRGGAGDAFRPGNARVLCFGLAFTHNTAVGGGDHDMWVDEVATAPLSPEASERLHAVDASSTPILDGISPGYKTYPITEADHLAPDARQTVWSGPRMSVPAGCVAPHMRPQGTGFHKGRRARWIPLLAAVRADGKTAGWPAVLVLNGAPPLDRSAWLSVPVTDREFLRGPEVIGSVGAAAERMVGGLFLYESGSEYYAYSDRDRSVTLGAKVTNLGRSDQTARVEITVRAKGDLKDPPAFDARPTITVGAGQSTEVSVEWSPGTFAAADYTVTTVLREGGNVIDRLEHPLTIWRPAKTPHFVTTRAGDFILDGRKWYAHGVNYMPSSGVATEDGPYFEFWLDPQPYDPDIVEADLTDIRDMGLNALSVFIYHRTLSSRNLWDLLARCERKGLKVNLSLRPGTPMDFRWSEMREIIESCRLAECDTVFAYDLAWEPFFGPYEQRAQWDGEWAEWVNRTYGSVEAAERAWGVAAPRADGKLTGPSNEQVAADGEWRELAIDYRRFVNELVHRKYAEARALVRSVDPNHLVSFRMTEAGDPTCGQGAMPYDLRGLAGAVDIMEPEGYGRIGDWEKVKPGIFEVAYARSVAPDAPIMWGEFGYSVWDNSTMTALQPMLDFQGRFYRDFYEMILKSGANGSMCWWFPGGWRYGERSDFGIINPDRSWRPVTHAIHDYAERITREREVPTADAWLDADDQHADGIFGLYKAVGTEFWRAVDEGRHPGLRWTK